MLTKGYSRGQCKPGSLADAHPSVGRHKQSNKGAQADGVRLRRQRVFSLKIKSVFPIIRAEPQKSPLNGGLYVKYVYAFASASTLSEQPIEGQLFMLIYTLQASIPNMICIEVQNSLLPITSAGVFVAEIIYGINKFNIILLGS